MAVGLDLSQVHRFSLDEYHRLIESGGFAEDARCELIHGLLVEKGMKTREHEDAIAWLNEWLVDAVDRSTWQARVGAALTLEDSEPEPDLMVIRRDAPRPYHPGTAGLVIEVAVSSLGYDLGIKARLYAGSGVPEYWVLDLDGRRLIVHRSPGDGGYGERSELSEQGRVLAVGVGLPELAVADALAAATA